MKEFLQHLLEFDTPSGYESSNFLNTRKELLGHVICNDMKIDAMNNVIFEKGSTNENAFKILISAHYDENAMIVTNITEKGMLHIMNLGGLDRKTIEGSHVYVYTDDFDPECLEIKRKKIPGVIGKKAIHVEKKDDRDKVDEYEDILIDVGCFSKEEVNNLGIHIGCIVVFKKDIDLEFGPKNDRIVANGLDDKIGVYAVTEAFNEIDDEFLKENDLRLCLVWFSQEEVGLRGATFGAENINANVSIDVDVIHDYTIYNGLKNNNNNLRIGNGVVIEYGVHCNPQLVSAIRDIANKYALSYQEHVSKPGGNNCSAIQLNSKKCITAHLGIPQRNMHTQVEMCHWDDVNSCIDLIKLYITETYGK